MALFRQSSSAGVLFSILVLSGWIHSNWAVQAQCVSNTWTIFNRESAVTDTSVQRSYTLCPNTNFSLGTYDYSYQIIRGTGTPMIPLRPNMSIKCGTDGSIHNNCIIKGGPVHLDGTNHFGFVNGTVENVVIQGVTFENAQRYMVWINKDGSVTFEECVFRVRGFSKGLTSYACFLRAYIVWLTLARSTNREVETLPLQFSWTTLIR